MRYILSKLNTGNSLPIKATIDLFQRIVKFCNNIQTEKQVQKDNSEVIATIYSIISLIKEQFYNIKPMKNGGLKPREENTIFYRDAITRFPFFKSEPASFKANKVIAKINDQSSSDSPRPTKETDLISLMNDILKKKNVSNINVKEV